MTPGMTFIKKCVKCGGLIRESTIGSGNTFGATFWTDGQMEAPMLPDHPWLVKCPHCKALVWIDEQAEVGKVEPCKRIPVRFKDARPFTAPTMKDYFASLREPPADTEKEQYIRLRAWRAGNDVRRRAKKIKQLSPAERQNLHDLLPLIKPTADGRLLKAEIHRELGEFDKAQKLLERPFGVELRDAADVIRKLVENKQSTVAEMQFEDSNDDLTISIETD